MQWIPAYIFDNAQFLAFHSFLYKFQQNIPTFVGLEFLKRRFKSNLLFGLEIFRWLRFPYFKIYSFSESKLKGVRSIEWALPMQVQSNYTTYATEYIWNCSYEANKVLSWMQYISMWSPEIYVMFNKKITRTDFIIHRIFEATEITFFYRFSSFIFDSDQQIILQGIYNIIIQLLYNTRSNLKITIYFTFHG